MNVDRNGQPLNKHFNWKRNKNRALHGLRGLLFGVVADRLLNETELMFLDVWLKEQKMLRRDGDVIDLLDLIGEILSKQIVTQEDLDELSRLIDDVIEFKHVQSSDNEGIINEFIGFLTGVIADDILNDRELDKITEWLENNPNLLNEWPVNVVSERMSQVLADGIITLDEKEHLIEVMKKITGIRLNENGIAYGMATEFFDEQVPIIYDNSVFCFTGTFVNGSRVTIQNMAKNKGAIIEKNMTKRVNYLVIGTLASRDWRFTTHGRKIEKALTLKRKGVPVAIISERTWVNNG